MLLRVFMAPVGGLQICDNRIKLRTTEQTGNRPNISHTAEKVKEPLCTPYLGK